MFDEGPSALDRSGQFVGETVLRLYRRARLAEFLRDEMDIENLVDKEHLAALNMFPDGLFDLDDFTAARRRFDEFIASLPVRPLPQTVSVADHIVESFDGHDLTVRVYRPDAGYSDLPGLFWIHGGGMVLGSVDLSDDSCAAIADELAVVVASVDYRLAPEFPYPIPMEDCYAGLTWFFDRAGSLGADPTRIAVGGASAGGGLAAGLALLARDRKTVSPCFQLLTYPMLDDRDKTPPNPIISDTRVWNHGANIFAWDAYLAGMAGHDDVAIYAAPSRATDLSGLPPAIITVGEFDMFRDENIAYAQALMHAGVAVEVHVYPGAFHASNSFVPQSDLAKRWKRDEYSALHRALHGSAWPNSTEEI